jgi:membrane protein required for beta-lactamase induction
MKFIAILIAVLVERYWPAVQSLRDMALFERYVVSSRKALRDLPLFEGVLGVAALMLPLLLIVAWLQGLFAKGILGLFGLAFAVVTLMASLGPRDLLGLVAGYLRGVRQGDEVKSFDCARQILDEVVPVESEALHRHLVMGLFGQINDWLPGVLFWFAVFGPVGAVAYRLVCVLRNVTAKAAEAGAFASAVEGVYLVLAWAPARITVAMFALFGSFDDTLRSWRAVAGGGTGTLRATSQLVVATGLASLRLDRDSAFGLAQVDATAQLLRRLLISWLTLAAVLTLLGVLK